MVFLVSLNHNLVLGGEVLPLPLFHVLQLSWWAQRHSISMADGCCGFDPISWCVADEMHGYLMIMLPPSSALHLINIVRLNLGAGTLLDRSNWHGNIATCHLVQLYEHSHIPINSTVKKYNLCTWEILAKISSGLSADWGNDRDIPKFLRERRNIRAII